MGRGAEGTAVLDGALASGRARSPRPPGQGPPRDAMQPAPPREPKRAGGAEGEEEAPPSASLQRGMYCEHIVDVPDAARQGATQGPPVSGFARGRRLQPAAGAAAAWGGKIAALPPRAPVLVPRLDVPLSAMDEPKMQIPFATPRGGAPRGASPPPAPFAPVSSRRPVAGANAGWRHVRGGAGATAAVFRAAGPPPPAAQGGDSHVIICHAMLFHVVIVMSCRHLLLLKEVTSMSYAMPCYVLSTLSCRVATSCCSKR
jgi:hypothetical protein